ncbi:rhodanese-like domain-containing protein [Bacteriovorax sp. PP10]|uniref:Rhodanese-like domain-containing protein n=1 Tax=Bacteriovorax antarcticus TaxID=3088717 RepID=A0ABU5VSC6_9BACT|nr:rhodanese-like domain-containing protein [Bacteriovorax sp. PP10]MEA9355963.1 rhodanese-like domain-containing protein [Bacteriovorax sp. PP10]
MKEINRNELIISMGSTKDLILIETLPKNYYDDGHIPGAINIDVREVEELYKKLGLQENQTIITYCAGRTCKNSHTVADMLTQKGFKNVYCYIGGKQDWAEANLPLIK